MGAHGQMLDRVIGPVEGEPHRGAAQFLVRDVDGGELGNEVGGERDVVEADDRHVVRDAQSGFAQRLVHAGGDHVGHREHSRELGARGEEFTGGLIAGLAGVRAGDDQVGIDGQTPALQGPTVARHAPGGDGVALDADQSDAFMAQREQIAGHAEGAALVVVLHDGLGDVRAEGGPSAQHQARAFGVQGTGEFHHPLGVFGRLHRTTDQDHGFGTLLAHEIDDGELAGRVVVRRAHQAEAALSGGLLLDTLGDVREGRPGDVVDDEGDGVAGPLAQRPRIGVDDVVQIPQGPLNPDPGDGGHRVRTPEDPGNRRGGNPCSGRDILDCRPPTVRRRPPRHRRARSSSAASTAVNGLREGGNRVLHNHPADERVN
jgi:hypothetical protein